IIELVAYAVFSGMLSEKINIYLNLLITMVFGRLIYGLSLIVAVKLLKMNVPFAGTTAFFAGITKGLPGIIIQLAIIPPIIYALKKDGFAFLKAK
ncbi:MAG: ECF transporter S component, partial [Oscillospiraceae bacterium]